MPLFGLLLTCGIGPHEKLRDASGLALAKAALVRTRACKSGTLSDVEFDSRSREFNRITGGTDYPAPPIFEIFKGEDVLGSSAPPLRAHEGPVFLEHGATPAAAFASGAGGDDAPCLIFVTTPYKEVEPGFLNGTKQVAQIKRLIVDGPHKGRFHTLFESENLVNGATLGFDGRIYFCFQGGIVAGTTPVRHLPSGIYSVDPHNSSDVRTVTDSAWNDGMGSYYNSPNDVVVKRDDGSVWFTDPSYAHEQGLTDTKTIGDWVWRVDAKSQTSAVVADGFNRPNGIVFSPDQKTMFVTDSGYKTGRGEDPAGPRSVYAFDVYNRGRQLKNRRLIYVADRGIPDGIKVDASGRIYTGCADGVHVLSRDGLLLGKIKLNGSNPAANLAFGKGKWRSWLYILDETSVTAVNLPGTRGAPIGRERR